MRAAERAALVALVSSLTLVPIGCARGQAPSDVLDEYYRNLGQGRIAAAYALTTPAYRRRHDLAAFALQVARQPILAPRERRLARPHVVVELIAATGDPLRVVGASPGGRLYLADDPRVLYPTSTPEGTLRSFARAIELGRRDRALDLCSPAVRERLGAGGEPLPEGIVELARLIRGRLGDDPPPLVLDGGSARWLIGDGRSVTLEHGRSGWWLVALD